MPSTSTHRLAHFYVSLNPNSKKEPVPNANPIIAVLVVASWENLADNEKANCFVSTFLSNLDTVSQKQGFPIPFTFLNDTQGGQKVFQRYGGGKSLPKLQKISKKYDTNGVFQKLEIGGFKLSAAGGIRSLGPWP